MRSTLDIVGTIGPAAGHHQGNGRTVLVVSGERVGRVFIVQSLREQGLHTVISDNAQQAVRRLSSEQAKIDGVVIVGALADGTGESYQRWLRTNGHSTMPLIGIGTGLDADDPNARTVDPREWFDAAPNLLIELGLRRRHVLRDRTPVVSTVAEAVA